MAERVRCYDCHLSYGSVGWIDAVVSDAVWERIFPARNGGGVLCINCMAKRCVNLGITTDVMLCSGPFTSRPCSPKRESENAAD